VQLASETLAVSDKQLWKTFKAGGKTDFAQIYEKHAAVLYNYGRHIRTDQALVKDCIQELFIDIWKNRKTLGATDSIKFYLLKSLRRKIIYEAKKGGKFTPTGEHFSSHETTTVSQPFELPQVAAQFEKAQQQKLLNIL